LTNGGQYGIIIVSEREVIHMEIITAVCQVIICIALAIVAMVIPLAAFVGMSSWEVNKR
jgi:hypothetical protein